MQTAPEPHRFAADEQPLFPGSPYSPRHPQLRRLGYGLIALLMGISATLGNALVTVNVPNLAGALGVYVVEASLLPAVYVAFNACANLMLIKARAQFGIPAVTTSLLLAYMLATLVQILLPGYHSAILVRAASGLAAAGLTTMTIYNLLQALPPKVRPVALAVGIVIPQFGTPIARLFPVEMLALSAWQGLHFIEMGIALLALAVMHLVPLPPSDRLKVFQPLDFLTFSLLLPATLLLCAVLSMGRYLWWTDTPWLGWALVASIILVVAAVLIEHRRAKPLLQISWVASKDILRFAGVAVLVRLALAEQTYGAVGLLSSSGLTNDQLRWLFFWVLLAMVLGAVIVVLLLNPTRLPVLVVSAALAIALGAWLDSQSNNLTRPEQLYWSQALLGLGTALFIGPSLLYGFGRMMQRGPDYQITFLVLFSVTQNLGGLAGSAMLGSYQVIATRAHALALSEKVLAADPQAAARLQGGAGRLAGVIADPVLRSAQGNGLLGAALQREAAALAFNDVFQLVAALALLTAAYVAIANLRRALIQRRQAAREAAPA
ncbi:hypothetical protein [Chitinimonas sp.]|uniref:hypothetical protein n=1 Tax=Chitinimonas sp. TaxID=1934313 RepID=UPI002F952C8E